MKLNFLLILILFSTSLSCNSQETESIYLLFDVESKETYQKEYDRMKYSKPVFRENNTEENICFYINDELFIHKKNDNSIETIISSNLDDIEFANIDFMYKQWRRSELVSKRNVFKRILLVKYYRSKKYLKVYEVQWVDYTE